MAVKLAIANFTRRLHWRFAAFIIELLYGILSWYVYRGGPGLFALITLGNLANLSFLSPAITGPEQYLAGRPMLVVTVVFVQIVVTLLLVWAGFRTGHEHRR